jgi:hypothetical protein
MAYKDMREFLAMLEKEGQLKHVDVPFDGRRGTQRTAVADELRLQQERPGADPQQRLRLQHEGRADRLQSLRHPRAHRHDHRHRDWREAKLHHAGRARQSLALDRAEARRPAQAPCKEVIIKGAENIALDKQLPHVWFGKEGPAYITNASRSRRIRRTAAATPAGTASRSSSTRRIRSAAAIRPSAPRRDLAAFYWWNPPFSDIGRHTFKASQMGKRLEVAIAGVCEPACISRRPRAAPTAPTRPRSPAACAARRSRWCSARPST